MEEKQAKRGKLQGGAGAGRRVWGTGAIPYCTPARKRPQKGVLVPESQTFIKLDIYIKKKKIIKDVIRPDTQVPRHTRSFFQSTHVLETSGLVLNICSPVRHKRPL